MPTFAALADETQTRIIKTLAENNHSVTELVDVSTEEHLNVWLLPVSRVERRLGGRASFTWGGPQGSETELLEVTVFDPPHAIQYTSTVDARSYLRFDLEPDGDGTWLRFTNAIA